MNAKQLAQYRWDHVAKPLHSLGRLEELIVQIAGIQQTADVRIDKRCALVFCAVIISQLPEDFLRKSKS